MKRREFLRNSATLALGTMLMPQISSWANAETTRRGPKLGLTTYMIGRGWTIPELIKHLTPLGLLGVELRTEAQHAHGVELSLNKTQRSEIRKQFKDSPLELVGIACSDEYNSPDPAVLKKSIESTKEYLQFCADLGTSGLRVRPNNFPKEGNIPQEKTLEQIADSLRTLAPIAQSLNVEIRVEAHGSVGTLPNMETIAKNVNHPMVTVLLNSDLRDTEGDGLLANLKKVQPYLSTTVHLNDLTAQKFTDVKFYEIQMAFLRSIHWSGWCLLEIGDKEDTAARIEELTRQRQRWDELMSAGQRRRPALRSFIQRIRNA